MSLCFDEAYQALKNEKITDEEYLHQVLAHFCGIRHSADERNRPWELMISDPVGNAIREAALNSPHIQPEGIDQLEKLFASALRDDAAAVKTIVSQLGQLTPIPWEAIATFAALHSDAAALRLCLQLGANLSDRNTSTALEFAARGPALLHLLYESDWREMRTSRQAINRMFEWSLHTGPQELSWFLDHGAIVDKAIVCRAVHGSPVKASCIAMLLQRFGLDILEGTRLLQSAAKRGRNDVVRILLKAGIDVDEMVPRAGHGSGESEMTALYEAVYKQHEDTIQMLLDYGADPKKEVCRQGLNTPLKLALAKGNSRIIAFLH